MTDPDVIEAQLESTGGELVPFPDQRRTVDLRNAATDSWTDVVADVAKLADYVAQTDFVPRGLRGNPAAVTAAVLHGREIGLPPMTALQGTVMIEGRPSLYAETMRALILQAGHEIAIEEATASRCKIAGRRKGSERWSTAQWTLDDARRAGLLVKRDKPTAWEKYPRQLLMARATTELARMIFPDVLHGMRSAEELLDEIDTVTEYQPVPPEPTTTVQRKTAKKTSPRESHQAGEPGTTAGADAPAHPPAPARKRAPLPAKKTSPAKQASPAPGEAAGRGGETTAAASADPPPPGPTVEQQQEEIRRLSSERRTLRDQAADQAADRAADQPGGRPAPTEHDDGRPTGPKLTGSQQAMIMMHFARLQLANDRDERLLWTNILLGYPPETIKSNNDLRQPEASDLIGRLETFKDRDALDASLHQDQLPESREEPADE